MMKETAADRETRDRVEGAAAAEIRQFVERIERIEEEMEAAKEARKEVYAESKARGYDTKVLRKVVALRKRDRDDIAEEEAILSMYREALGL